MSEGPNVSSGSVTGSQYKPLSDADVDRLAKEFYRNEIFFSFQAPKEQLSMIFMVVIFLDDITLKQMVADEIDVFYEYYKDAGPRSINGYPSFMSCRMLNRTDGNRIIERYNQIRELLGDNTSAEEQEGE